jgi:nucleotide-binding universal stress UspA family protein
MSDIDKRRAERDARQSAGDLLHASRYGAVVNRYLGAVGYREAGGEPAAVRQPRPAVDTSKSPAGVVLVGVDETPTSYTAVDHAAIEAELHGWDLRLFHVQRAAGLRYSARDEGARLIERMTNRVHAYSPTVAVSSHIAVGTAASLLLSDAYSASLVVVGHRHSAAGTAFGLSVGDRVAAHHSGPVLVVRVPGWPPGPDFGARPIVVGVDGKPGSAEVVEFAVAEARIRGCDVVMLHAGDPERAAEYLLETSGDVVLHRRTVAGDPVDALIEASGKAAAVVVGRRGPGAFAGALLGSVSRSMVQHAHCPVFLVG